MDDGENAPGSFPLFFDFLISQNVEEAKKDSGPNNALLRPFLQFGNRLKTLNWNVLHLDSTGLNFCFLELVESAPNLSTYHISACGVCDWDWEWIDTVHPTELRPLRNSSS
jgi:hypothetical protein